MFTTEEKDAWRCGVVADRSDAVQEAAGTLLFVAAFLNLADRSEVRLIHHGKGVDSTDYEV